MPYACCLIAIILVASSTLTSTATAGEQQCAVPERAAPDCTRRPSLPAGPQSACKCERCLRKCVQRPECPTPQYSPTTLPPAASYPSASGVFAAPPASGTVAGESNAIGLNGPALHFPAMSLRMPTLQLPSLTRFRSGARMRIDAAEAPFVAQGQAPMFAAAPVPAMSTPLMAPMAVAPSPSPVVSPPAQPASDCPDADFSPQELLQALEMIRQSKQSPAAAAPSADGKCGSGPNKAGLESRLKSLESREQELLDQLKMLEKLINQQAASTPQAASRSEAEPRVPITGSPRRLPQTVTESAIPAESFEHVRHSSYLAPVSRSPRVPSENDPNIERLPMP